MKTKDLKNYLKSEANKISVPDLSEKILLESKYSPRVEYTKQVKTKRKNIFVFAIPSALVTALAIIICVLLLKGNTINPLPNPGDNIKVTKAKEVIGQEILLAGSLYDSNQGPYKKMSFSTRNDYYEDALYIHDYLITAELLMNKDNITMEIYENEDSNYPYDYRMEVTYEDSLDYLDYVFYYSEKLLSETDDSDEVSISFSGVMIAGDNVYDVKGTRENEENEEFTTITELYQNGVLLLEIEQETEINENEYTYKYYDNNGKLTKEVSQEVEYEERKTMSIEVEDFSKGESFENTREFEFEYFADYIICKYESEVGEVEKELEFTIIEYETYYLYKIEDEEFKINK